MLDGPLDRHTVTRFVLRPARMATLSASKILGETIDRRNQRVKMGGIPMKSLTICLCSSGTRETLKSCLASLESQYVPQDIEISLLLVDNSRDALLKDLIDDRTNPGLASCYLHEPRTGIPFARNAALKQARAQLADWVAFIDDDEIAPRHWVSQLLAHLNANHADAVVGEVGRCETLEAAVQSARNRQPQEIRKRLPRVKTAVTSNVLLASRIYSESAMALNFDERMVFGGSDREFFMRAIQKGAHIVYAANELVYETWPIERRKPTYLLMRWFRHGVSFNYRYRKNMPPLKGHALIVLMFLYKLLGAPFKLLFFPFRKTTGNRWIPWIFGAPIHDVAYSFGCLAPFFGVTLNKYY